MIASTTTPTTTTLTIRLLASTSSKGRCITSRVFRTFSSSTASNNNNNNGRYHFSASPAINDVDEEDDNDDNSSLSLSTVVATNDHHRQHQQQHQQVEGGVTALILGKPGGGKGTISNKILKDFPNFKHLSTGDMLRQHVRDCTTLGKEAKSYMNNGQLVPDDIMIQMVLNEAIVNDDNNNNKKKHVSSLLLDGFPRTMEQAIALDNVMDINFVINLNIPTETIVERISDRWIHAPSGRVYSYSYKPPKVVGKDDVTGEPLVQRCDDEASKVRQRLEAYDKITFPLIDYYNQKGILQTFTGTMSDVIYPNVKTFLINKLLVLTQETKN